MGFFSLFSRKKNRKNSEAGSAQLPDSPVLVTAPAKLWHHSIESLVIVTHPLGQTPGTDLERDFLLSTLHSLALEISQLRNEEGNLHSPFFSLASALTAKAAAENLLLEKFEIVGLTYEPTLGFSSRMSAAQKKFTLLFGESGAVARASTPFHSEIASFPRHSESSDSDLKRENFVLAIDGIAYAAMTLLSTFSA